MKDYNIQKSTERDAARPSRGQQALEKKGFFCYVDFAMALGFSHHESTTRTQNRRCRSRRAARRTSLAALAFLGLLAAAPARAFEEVDGDDFTEKWERSESAPTWIFSPALYGGFLDPIDGYPRYESFVSGGLDFYMRPPIPQFPRATDKFIGRISFNYFPLEVPEEVRGVMHDIYSLDLSVVYRLTKFSGRPEHTRWVPFLGGGVGVYQDMIKTNHPALSAYGELKIRETYMGFNASGGFMLPCLGRIRLIPEVRYHALKVERGNWATHISYQLGFAYWIPDRIME